MNCRPGDMAMVVESMFPRLLGRIITVHNLLLMGPKKIPCWSYTGNLSVPGYQVEFAEDYCLRPIRDPGDDAVDEMVQLHGKPVEETV